MKDEKENKRSTNGKEDRRESRRGRRNNRERRTNMPAKVCMNDPNWYVLNPELLRDAASLPFSHFFGKGFDLHYANTQKAREHLICKINYLYTLGVSSTSGDPVNLAIRNLYTYVRHQNSGHTNYESADLGIYLLAVASVVASLAHVERCIGIAKFYQRRSSIMPYYVLRELGVTNVPAFISNLANYTTRLNVMWQRVSSLCIPKDFSFLKRWIWMNSQVFKDHESDKAALYIFKPIGVPIYNFKSLDAGSISQPVKESLTPTIDDWFNDCDTALDAILGDEDMNIMSGDILKAYGEEQLLKFGMTPIDYVLEPVYVEEMLPQIQHLQTPKCDLGNSNTLHGIRTGINYDVAQSINDQTNSIYTAASDDDYFTIYQWNGEVVCCPVPSAPSTTSPTIDSASGTLYWETSTNMNQMLYNNENRILNSYKVSVPPEDVMIATRLMYTSDVDTRVSAKPVFYTSCGTELVAGLHILFVESTNPNLQGLDLGTFIGVATNTPPNVSYLLNVIDVESQFDWYPITYFVSYNGNDYFPNTRVVGDVDNFTVIAPSTLQALHLTALLAEFSVTQYNLIKG